MYEYALLPVHRRSISDDKVTATTISSTGALSVASGEKTGRTPKDKRIVLDDTTKDVSDNILSLFRPSGGAMSTSLFLPRASTGTEPEL